MRCLEMTEKPKQKHGTIIKKSVTKSMEILHNVRRCYSIIVYSL